MTFRRRVLVTGASGFVGTYLTETLRAGGHEVHGVGRRELATQGYTAIDMRDARGLRGIVAAFEPHHVVHLASICYLPAVLEDPATSFDVNVLGTLNLFEAIAEHAPLARTLVASSCVVYGDPPEGALPLREDADARPVHPYAQQKYGAERIAQRYRDYGLSVVCARPFNHVGPGMDRRMSVAHFAHALAEMERGEREPTMGVGNLAPRRDFLDVRDVVDAYERLLAAEDPPFLVNVASGVSISIREVLDTLLEEIPFEVRVHTDPARVRSMDVMDLRGDATLLRDLTGWQPQHDVRETFRAILRWARRIDP